MMACTKLLLIGLCLHAVCAFTTVAADLDPRGQEELEPLQEEQNAAQEEEEEEVSTAFSPATNISQITVLSGGNGKYFNVQSQYSGYCMDIPYSNTAVGNIIQMHSCELNANQLWTYDRVYGVMRSKINCNKVLSIGDSYMALDDFSADDERQLFEPKSPVLFFGHTNKYVIEISGTDSRYQWHQKLVKGNYRAEYHQRWTFHYRSPVRCYIRSRLNNKYWTATSTGSGAMVELQSKNSETNQLWWEDNNGLIHSYVNGEIVTARDGHLYTSATGNGQQWVRSLEHIHGLHTPGRRTVLQIEGGEYYGTQIGNMIKKPDDFQRWIWDCIN